MLFFQLHNFVPLTFPKCNIIFENFAGVSGQHAIQYLCIGLFSATKSNAPFFVTGLQLPGCCIPSPVDCQEVAL
jgi:hypothetical protein